MTSAINLPPLLTVGEVAELLRLHRVVVRGKLRHGDIPGVKVGANSWRIPRSYIEAILRGESEAES